MKRLCLVALFFCAMVTASLGQNCRTQDSLTLVSFQNSLQFKPGFGWSLELPMENWYGVTLSPEGCVEQLNLAGVLDFFYTYTLNTSTLPQLTHLDFSNNGLGQLPDMTAATQLLYVNVAYNNFDFYDLQKLPSSAELVYTPQGILNNYPKDVEVFVGDDYTIKFQYYSTPNEVFVWYKDNVVIDTTTSNQLELTDVQLSDEGTYEVVITNFNFPDLTLEPAPIMLSVGSCRERDSLILASFYHDVQFKTAFEWDIESPMENWYGVTLSPEGCVEELDLSGVMYGQVNYYYGRLDDLSQLTYLDLSNNGLKTLPNLSDVNQLTYLNVSNNSLDFQDLSNRLPDSTAGEVIYAPQGILNCPMDIQAYVNTDYTITLDYYGTDNDVFVWYKDGTTIIDTTAIYNLELTDIQLSDAGVYTAIITDTNFPELTLETAPITLGVGSCRERDSLALVHFYEKIEFKEEAPEWDLSQPMDSWYGVILSSEGCLERLEIPNTLNSGQANSYSMGNFSNLTHLDLSGNQLTTISGVVGIPDLTYLNVQNNQLDLVDLLPLASVEIDSFLYHPQLPVSVSPDAIIDIVGSHRTIIANMHTYQNPGNIFKWHRDGIIISTLIDEGRLNLSNLQVDDSGMYVCEMTNSELPDLVLYSDTIRVQIAPNTQHLDSLILVDFYESTTFKPGHDWDLLQPMNTWEGVTLNETGRVQALVLPNILTGGELYTTIQQLADLETIDLSNNNLTGGFITHSDGSFNILPKLSSVDLSNNQLSGQVNFQRLEIPENLKYLDFSNNDIAILGGTSLLTNLEHFDLSNNPMQYNSFLPYFLPPSADLKVLKLSDNQFKNRTYTYQNYIERPQLHTIDLQNNQMSSLVPGLFESSVGSLNVSGNQLTFEDLLQSNVPETYIYAPQDTVGVGYSVHLPPGDDYTIYLEFDENVENNTYTWYKDGGLLITTLDGKLPLTNLQTADIGDYTCQVTNPTLPDLTIYTKPVTITVNEIYYNCRLRDSLALVQIGAPENHRDGDLHWHNMSEPLENWVGVTLSEEGCVTGLDFDDDEITRISPAIGQLLDLETLYYKENYLSGIIPRTIGNLTKLRYFSVIQDNVDGIPVELTMLPNLETLIIAGYIDEIPPEIGNMTSLKTLRLGGGFTELPPEIGHLTNLETLSFSAKLTTLPAEMSNMVGLKNVHLINNELNTLPENLAENWINLEEIDLKHNYLSFDDLLQFQAFNFGYQNAIGTPDTIELTSGGTFMIELGFDENIADNTYHWFRNGSPIDTTTQNKLILSDLQLNDVGFYTCLVYNPNMPNYYLNTAPITLIIEGNAPESPVYPGDANADGIVSGADILLWGLAEGNTGEVRPNASVAWTPQPTPDWDNAIGGINGKHQDTDGSGLVDEADLDIIEVNYQKTNINYQHQFYQDDALQISPQIAQAQNFDGSSVYEVEIRVGNNVQGTTPIHGLSFSLDLSNLNSAESYTAELTNTNSWLAPSNIISIHDDFARNSDFTLTRSDLQNKTGIGSIGTLSIITEDLPTIDTPQFRAVIRDVTAIQSDGTLLHGEDVFIGSFSSGSADGAIPALEFEAIAYAATCEEPSSATVTITSGTPPYEYQWGNGDNTATAENLPPGEHQVIVTDSFGQTLTAMVIVPNGTPLPDVELQTNTGGAIELISNIPDIQYEWNELPGASTTPLTPGQHTLTVSNSEACSKTVSIWVADIYSNVILEGAYDATSGLMNDRLRQLNLIPLTDPYTERMTTTDAVLQVTGNAAIVDWVLVELHDKDIPGKVIASYPALLRRDGFIISNDGINPPRIAVTEETDYYLVVKHRNHLPVRSGTTVSLANEVAGQTFEQGNASLQKQMNDGIYAAFAGDISTDHTIDGADKIIWEPMNGSFNQYHAGDTNLDGDINGADKGVWFSNNGTFTDIE